MSQHILTHHEEIAARPGGHNDPVHLVTAYLNEFSGKFGVEKKTDIFIENFSIDDNDYKNCEDALRAGLSVYNMASFLAENYLNSAREIAVIGEDGTIDHKIANNFINNFKSIYGDITLDMVFSFDSEDEMTGVTSDPTPGRDPTH